MALLVRLCIRHSITTASGKLARRLQSDADRFGLSRVSTPPISAADQDLDTPQSGGSLEVVSARAQPIPCSAATLRRRPPGYRSVYRLRGDAATGKRSASALPGARRFPAIAPLLDAARGTALDTPEANCSRITCPAGTQSAAFAGHGLAKARRAIQAMLGACLAPSADRTAEASQHINSR